MKTSIKYSLAFLICWLIVIPALYSQTHEQLFQEAMVKEEAEGDLEAAIEIYSELANDINADRGLRARALLQSGLCYEKLGRNNAIAVYEKLVSEYSDQPDVTSLAIQKLKQYQKPEYEPVQRLIAEHIKHEENDRLEIYEMSPDGNYYLFVNWDEQDIFKYDLRTEEVSAVTEGNTWFPQREGKEFPSVAWQPVWSHDSKRVAYIWISQKGTEIRIRDVDGTNMQSIFSDSTVKELRVADFAPDGSSLYLLLEIDKPGEFSRSQKLALLDIASGEVTELIDFDKRFVSAYQFQVSPSGDYVVYARCPENSTNTDIWLMSLRDFSIQNVTSHAANDAYPDWSPDESSILFVSDRTDDNDLYMVNVRGGRASGSAELIKSNLGISIDALTVGDDGSVFYVAGNTRWDVHTFDVGAYIENGEVVTKRITSTVMKHGGIAPSYSQDGRYMSFINWGSNEHDISDEKPDANLGRKYFITIYDTETGAFKELDLALYENDHWSDLNEYVPQWSPDGKHLVMHGMVREKYAGGFYLVDVETGELTPMITRTNSLWGNKFRAGRLPFFSRNSNVVYYLSADWKDLREFNVDTKEDNLIVHDDHGYFFRGYSEDENQFYLVNSKGKFVYDRPAGELRKVEEQGSWPIYLSDRRYSYYVKHATPQRWKSLNITDELLNKEHEVDLEKIFPESGVWLMSVHPEKLELAVSMKSNFGKEIMRLHRVFN